ncbi:MAG TPA: hypothetical protein VED01_01930 [Burkholderiales bacterium]|nr:hypothetical protein [Burkholderiales bacterium]
MKTVLAVLLGVFVASGPALAAEGKKKSKADKPATGAACKAPAVGRCAACSITCPPAETAMCSPGQAVAEACHVQPSCKCTK